MAKEIRSSLWENKKRPENDDGLMNVNEGGADQDSDE